MRKYKIFQCVLAFFVLLIVTSCAGIYENGKELAADTKPYIEEISVEELNIKIENLEEFFLIDVRQATEFEKGSLPYSTLIPRGELEFKIGNKTFWEEEQWHVPLKDADIVIYCKKGNRGILATKALKELGYTNVKNLAGGIVAWDPSFESGAAAEESGGCG